MEKTEVIQKLISDENYYGDFGKQYLSNSDIKTLLNNPLELKTPSKQIPAFLVGGYFHTAILEPDKLKNFKVVEASSRNTKAYKEITQGEMCLLQHEVDQCELLIEKVMDNKVCRDLIHGDDVEYERPNITDLFGNKWKGKADIVNHSEKLVIDLKSFKRQEILRSEINRSSIKVNVIFETLQIKALIDQDEKIIDGDVNKEIIVKDEWIFERKINQENPNWTLIETKSM